MSIISDLLLILISLVGFGYIVSGKPKSRTHRYVNRYGDEYFYINSKKKTAKSLA